MTTEPVDWMRPPCRGWTYDQVKDLDLPFEWDLVDGVIRPRAMTDHWHDSVRDELYFQLASAGQGPYAINTSRCVLLDAFNPARPDVVVFDGAGLDFFTLECVPVAAVSLIVEVVSPVSRADDRHRKPGMYAEAGVPSYWRVERGEDDFPVLHEFWLDQASGVYTAANRPERAAHTDRFRVEVPFPVEIDLKSIFRF
ncbi:Uma2 family endonuclease [Streptomyces syringium]|uniref:Uma2 family endonuclease n=1 Tax=Streptomyces syringium TaxID=76729 RepID=UPI003D8C7F8E